MYPAVSITKTSDELGITSTAQLFATLKMAVGQLYEFVANTDTWICQGIIDTVFTAASSVFTVSGGHKLTVGQPVQLTAGTSLPTGLSAATTYFAIVLTATTFELASSLANAVAGTKITTSDNGSGTLTAKTVAVKAAGSRFVPAGYAVPLSGNNGAALSVLEDSADGKGTLVNVQL